MTDVWSAPSGSPRRAANPVTTISRAVLLRPFLPAISAQVRAASDVRLFVATHAPGAPHRLARIAVSTTARR